MPQIFSSGWVTLFLSMALLLNGYIDSSSAAFVSTTSPISSRSSSSIVVARRRKNCHVFGNALNSRKDVIDEANPSNGCSVENKGSKSTTDILSGITGFINNDGNNPFAFLFGNNSENNKNNVLFSKRADEEEQQHRQQAKDALFQVCQNIKQIKMNEKEKRLLVEQAIETLRPYTPVQNTASSPLLQTKWNLLYTTEKEINFFLDAGISNEVIQIIDGTSLTNNIAFVKGGYLGVQGTLTVDEENTCRTNFVFDTCTLDLAKFGTYQLPPVGKGWFDTIYLDDELRIDTNSRNDILICTADAS